MPAVSQPPVTDISSLLPGIRQRNVEAWKILYDQYAPVLYGVGLRSARPELAEEWVEKAFLKAFRHIREYDPARGRFLPWVLRLMAEPSGSTGVNTTPLPNLHKIVP
ncbi:MAG TPA: sigma factor [Flavisolibacter sp.]|nr:sigma factor [Flavisolibacter sp.]